MQEYIDGGTLKALVAQQMEDRWKVLYRTQDAVRWLLEIAQGLQYLHEREPMVRAGCWIHRRSIDLSVGRKLVSL